MQKTPISVSAVTRVQRDDGWHLVVELLPSVGLPTQRLEHTLGITSKQADALMLRLLRERSINRELWRAV